MKHPRLWCTLGLIFLVSLVTIGFEAGQDQKKSPPTPTTVTSPPEVVDPARQALVEQLKHYRKIGDRAGEAAIWKLLDPGLTFMPSESPSDIVATPAIEGSPGFQVQWQTPDVPVFFNSVNNESHPAIDYFRSGTNFPWIFAACEGWNGTSAPDNIAVFKSSDHGMSWPADAVLFDDYGGALAAPQIKQTSTTHMGMVLEDWKSASDPNIWFARMLASSVSTANLVAIDTSTANTQKPCLTSDVEQYGGEPYEYIAYYQITYEPAVNPSQPYRYNLMFTRSFDLGVTFTTPASLAEFRGAAGAVPVHCSIDYEADTLYLAYISGSAPAISVMKSTDWGSTWSSPTLLYSGYGYEPEVAVGDATHAIVAFTHKYSPTDEDPDFSCTTNGTNWTWGNLSYTVDLQNSPVVRYLGGRYYAAYRDSSLGHIYTTNANIDSLGWSGRINVKNSANAVSVSPRAVNLIAKPGPSGAVGSAAIWVEDSATADIYFDAAWLGTPVIRTPISDISFGNVGIGNYMNSATRIYNDGNGLLTVNSITRTAGSADFTYRGPATPFYIEGGGYSDITIRFTPTAVGPFSATFTVSSDAPTATFNCSANGIFIEGADINMPVTVYNFGYCPITSYKEANLTVQNLGNAALTISSVTRSSGSSDFTVVSYPSSIAVGASGTITIGVKRTSWGTGSATFAVLSNDPDEGTYNFAASAVGYYGLWLLVKGQGTNEIYRVVMDTYGTWSQWELLTGATEEPLGGASFVNSRGYIVAKGLTTMDIWYKSIGFSGVWSGWAKVTPGESPSTSALCYFNSRLYLAVRGADNGIYLRSMNTSGVWGPWTMVPGATSAAPALAFFNNRLHLIVKGLTDNSMWHNSMDTSETWAGWELLDGASPTTPGLAQLGDRLYLAVKGMDNMIYLKSMNTSGTWSSWTPVSLGATSYTPALSYFPTVQGTFLYMVVKGLGDGSIWVNKMNTSGVWESWTQLPGGTSTAPCLFFFPY